MLRSLALAGTPPSPPTLACACRAAQGAKRCRRYADRNASVFCEHQRTPGSPLLSLPLLRHDGDDSGVCELRPLFPLSSLSLSSLVLLFFHLLSLLSGDQVKEVCAASSRLRFARPAWGSECPALSEVRAASPGQRTRHSVPASGLRSQSVYLLQAELTFAEAWRGTRARARAPLCPRPT